MFDIASELARLHILSGSAYSKQVERIAKKGKYYPVKGEEDIFSAIGAAAKITRDFLMLLVRQLPMVSRFTFCLIREVQEHLTISLSEREPIDLTT